MHDFAWSNNAVELTLPQIATTATTACHDQNCTPSLAACVAYGEGLGGVNAESRITFAVLCFESSPGWAEK